MKKENILFYSLAAYVFLLIIFSLINYNNITEWALVELLINYQGGFVRRGLLGELNFITKDIFSSYYPIIPIIILSFLYLLNFFMLIFLFLKLKKNNLLLFLIILLSPATILFNVYDPAALFRKDVIFITAILLHTIIINLIFENKFKADSYNKLLSLIIIPILSINMLIHEVQIFFILPHILLSMFVYNNFKENFKKFIVYLVPFVFFLIVFFNKGDSIIINEIKNSLSYYPSEIINKPYNPIHYLEGNIFLILGNSIKLFFWYNYETSIQLLIAFFLSFYFFWYLLKSFYKQNYKFIDDKYVILKNNLFKKLSILFFIIIIISMPVAIDFGRFFHLITMHLIAIFLCLPKTFFLEKYNFSKTLHKSFIKVFIFAYFTLWVLPHGYVGYAGTKIYQSGLMKTNKKIISQMGLNLEKNKIIKFPKIILDNFEKNK